MLSQSETTNSELLTDFSVIAFVFIHSVISELYWVWRIGVATIF
jgi:hypothetical protein